MYSYWRWLVTLLLIMATSVKLAYAEGGDKHWTNAWGVNRVVHADGYYTDSGVTATITFWIPTDKNYKWTTESDPYDDKPTVYLGGSGTSAVTKDIVTARDQHGDPTRTVHINPGTGVEVDAGLQVETGVVKKVLAGWTAFISVQGGYTSPRIWVADSSNPDGGTSQPWRASTLAINPTMSLNTENGWVLLNVSGTNPNLGPFFWNQDKNYAQATSAHKTAPYKSVQIFGTTGIKPKHTVGMTRGANHNSELDGSTLSCILSNGWLGNIAAGWPSVNQQSTGYDAPGNGAASQISQVPMNAWDARWPWDSSKSEIRAIDAKTIVSFLGGGDTFNFQSRKGTANYGSAGRYVNESMSINLRRACRPQGEDIQW